MAPSNTAKNLNNFYIWFLPIIIAAKIVRWTVMYAKLIWMSIGNGMVARMNRGEYSFRASILSEATNSASVAENNAGDLFRAINIFGITTRDQWEVFITILFNILIFYSIVDFYKRTPHASTRENIFVYMGVAILNIFCFCLSKEPYQMLFFFLMAFAIKIGKTYRMKSILLSGVLILTVLYSRKYYGLVLLYYYILQYIVRKYFDNINFTTKNGKKKLIINILISSVIIGICYFFLLGYLAKNNEDTYQEMLDANYRDQGRSSVADSEIVPIFSGGNRLVATADYVIKIFRLMFPIELLLRGKINYLFLIAYQGLLAIFIGRAFITRRQAPIEEEEEEEEEVEEIVGNLTVETETTKDEQVLEEEEEVEEEEDDEEDEFVSRRIEDRRDSRTAALYLYLAFLFCSAAFEPDFGSWIRHQGVVLPVLLLIL